MRGEVDAPVRLHKATPRRADESDRDKLSRVLATINQWERLLPEASEDDAEILRSVIRTLRWVIGPVKEE